jgi:hypothetical protein
VAENRYPNNRPGNLPRASEDCVTVTIDFNRLSDPELFALVTAVPPGKQRARRVRSLMLMGHMASQLRHGALPVTGNTTSGGSGAGAAGVFDAPIER